jgi:hypothetical protein
MKPQVGDLRTVTQRFDGEQWVLCLQSMPPRELSRNEITEVIAEFAIKSLTNNLDYYDFAEALLKKASEK